MIRINSILIIPVGNLGGAIQHAIAKGSKVWIGLCDQTRKNFPMLNVFIYKERTRSQETPALSWMTFQSYNCENNFLRL